MRNRGFTFEMSGQQRKAAVTAILVWMGLSLELRDPGKEQIILNLIASFQGFELARFLLIPGLYFLFRRAGEAGRTEKRGFRIVPACFFALNMVMGPAFYQEGSWDMLLGLGNGQIIKAAAVFASWYAVFYAGLTMLFAAMDHADPARGGRRPEGAEARGGFHPIRWYGRMMRRHSFLTPFLTLLILFLPHLLIAYPVMFMGDTWSMVVQGYSEMGLTGVEYLAPERIIRAGVYINQHHPAAYTLLMHLCLRIGEGLFHSLNAGMFLLCAGQFALMMAAFAYAISTLARKGVRTGILAALALYVFLHPQIRNYPFLATKDGVYCACFLAFMAAFFRLRTGEGAKKEIVIFCLGAAGVVLFRNEGKYALIISGLLMAITDRKIRKRMLCFTAAALIFTVGIYRGLYPALGYTKGGTQEELSVPLQQTARMVRDHGEDISGKERDAIDAVLDYDRLAEAYDSATADYVKDLYRQEATGQEVLTFLKAWAGLALRHPGTCVQATYANYYQYLYPGETRMDTYQYGWSAWMLTLLNEKIAPWGKSFSLPAWNERGRMISDSLVDAGLLNWPPFSLMMKPALYSWMLIAMLFWAAGGKKGERGAKLSLIMPSLMTFLVLFVGPMNGFYSRYMLPLTSFLPFLFIMLGVLKPNCTDSRL